MSDKDLGPITKEIHEDISKKGLARASFDFVDTTAGHLSDVAMGVAKMDPIAIGEALSMFVPTSRPVRALGRGVAKTAEVVGRPIVNTIAKTSEAAFPLPGNVAKDLQRLTTLVDEGLVASPTVNKSSGLFKKVSDKIKEVRLPKEDITDAIKKSMEQGSLLRESANKLTSDFLNNPKVAPTVAEIKGGFEKVKNNPNVASTLDKSKELLKKVQNSKQWREAVKDYKYGKAKFNKNFTGEGSDTVFADGGIVRLASGGLLESPFGYDPTDINRRMSSDIDSFDFDRQKNPEIVDMIEVYKKNVSMMDKDFNMTNIKDRSLAFETDRMRSFIRGYMVFNNITGMESQGKDPYKNIGFGERFNEKYLIDLGRHPNFPTAASTFRDKILGTRYEVDAPKKDMTLEEMKAFLLKSIKEGQVSNTNSRRDLGTIVNKASGGRIFGEGGPREDKVKAFLSPGEFVIRAKAAQELGYDKLEYMNKKAEIPGFAEGTPGNTSFFSSSSIGNKTKIDSSEIESVIADFVSAVDKLSKTNVKIEGLDNLPSIKIEGLDNMPKINIDGLDNLPSIKVEGLDNLPKIGIEGIDDLKNVTVSLDTKTVSLDSSSLQRVLSNLNRSVGADKSAERIEEILEIVQKQVAVVKEAGKESINLLNSKQEEAQAILESKINQTLSTELASLKKEIYIVDSKSSDSSSKVGLIAQRLNLDISNINREVSELKTKLYSKLG